MFGNMKISIHRHESNASYLVELNGAMDHKTLDALHELAEFEDIESCVFDFKGITHCDLSGMMQWLNYTHEFFQGKQVSYKNCRTQWIMLLQQVPQLMNNVQLDSIIAEYVCHECDDFSEKTILAKDHAAYFEKDIKEERRCENCLSGTIDLIENEEDLFFFLFAA